MVSFSCEGCGDVLTKKKLDPHRGQCRGASFTCIDCMVHFNGTEYRSHTSCMSEAQKYQGALYKEKQNKNQQKGKNTPNKNGNQNARNQQPRVEDASDVDLVKSGSLANNFAPPPAPTPPPASQSKPTSEALTKPVNVFDYLVADETPNASKVSLGAPNEPMAMVDHAPSVFEPSKALANLDTKTDDEEFVTPAPKKKKDRRKEEKRASASEKKRKRGQEDPLSSPPIKDLDTPMVDAPSSVINNAGTPLLNHSGLTGGLNRMMRSPSHELDDSPAIISRQPYQDASSPIKRSRRNGKETNGKEAHGHGDPGLGISIKNRAERLVSSMFGGTGSVVSGSSGGGTNDNARALVRTRRGSDSSADMQLEVRKKKSHRSRTASDQYADVRKSKRKSSNPTDGDRPSRRQKQSDERRRSDSRSPHRDSRQVTVYKQSKPPARRDEDPLTREMAEHFLSLVSRDSERGCSIHKALKRFHRDFDDGYEADRERQFEDEKDLWRALRLRRNDRGEIVVSL